MSIKSLNNRNKERKNPYENKFKTVKDNKLGKRNLIIVSQQTVSRSEVVRKRMQRCILLLLN